MRSFRVLSRLLTYPQAKLFAHMDEMKAVLVDEKVLKGRKLKAVTGFMDELSATELITAQETYVELFDRGRSHCLHLFEHVHGESHFRGQAMIELAARYEDKGLTIGAAELPDYLPLFLEFVSICEPKEAQATLSQAAPVIATIGEKLKRRESGYATVMEAIVALSGVRLSRLDIKRAADAAMPDIQTLDDLDKEWAEPEAFDGSPDCGTCGENELPALQQIKGA
ncbi:MAG: nitrate reductase molybdenum cofactor assembly chaperone [Nitrospirota bacterium]|nr:nitrate reductase molybdenum cofactor assembly chaperone [Nitrospirota bacterium]